jgi:hypothetical protein
LTVQLGDRRFEVPAGGIAWLGRGVSHTFANLTTSRVKVIRFLTPAGLEGMFEETASYLRRRREDSAEPEPRRQCAPTALNGKVVIDAANNIGAPVANSVAIIQSAANEASVYRAFNIYGWENFAEPEVGGVRADLFYAGTDGRSRQAAEQLIIDVGLNPVWVGGPGEGGAGRPVAAAVVHAGI